MSDRVVLITGASSGIGLETALAFAKKEYQVFAGIRNPQSGEDLQNAISKGLPIAAVPLNVDHDESVAAGVGRVLEETGGIDVLINNAGFGGGGPIELAPLRVSKAIFETNYFGAIRMMQAVLPGMRERGNGTIVNVSSVVARVVFGAHAHYTASKAALEAASEALAIEVKPLGIRVVIVEPGVVLTPIWSKGEGVFPAEGPYGLAVRRLWKHFEAQLSKPTLPGELAEVIVNAVETSSPKLRYAAGADAEISIPARARLSDEEWIDLMAEPDDERFAARAREVFGMHLFHAPSARQRRARGEAIAQK